MPQKRRAAENAAEKTAVPKKAGAKSAASNKAATGSIAEARRAKAANSAAAGPRQSRLSALHVDVPNVGRIRIIQVKAANVVEHLGGSSATARVLGVARSQPGRWVKGTEAPSAASTKQVVDLDYVLSRLQQLYGPEVAREWLTSPNSYLDGARPLDVLMAEGPSDVIKAIDATIGGAYA
jgi:uncharacterized protein (DUF2384 family)